MLRKITVAFGYFISKVLYIPLIVFYANFVYTNLVHGRTWKQLENIHESL